MKFKVPLYNLLKVHSFPCGIFINFIHCSYNEILPLWMFRILDNLPVAVLRQRRDGNPSTTYEHGFLVGFKGNYAGV